MARAHRHYLPDMIWHLTHRCHERQFLLKFAGDRQAWIGWLFKSRKRLGISFLIYMVTSNPCSIVVRLSIIAGAASWVRACGQLS